LELNQIDFLKNRHRYLCILKKETENNCIISKKEMVWPEVPIHSRSEKSRLINPAKIYSIDTGLLNAMTFRNSYNYGQLLETMVFMHLRRGGYDAEYVNTKDGREADFFTRHRISGETQLIQVCWEMSDENTFARELQGLRSAMDELSIPTGTIVTWDDETAIENNIKVIPIWKWLIIAGDSGQTPMDP
jgi:predicted AAA+ superfamily ATPase